MGQSFPFLEKIAAISHSAGDINLASGSLITIGGQQYSPGALTRTISLDVTLTARNAYMVYAVVSGGVVSLRISTNINSVGPAGFTAWKLVGAFYTDASAAFDSFVSKTGASNSSITTILSGSGTYNTALYAPFIKVKMAGGGGGGAGGGSTDSGNGGAATATTFGTSLLTANQGSFGVKNSVAFTPGGTAVVNAPAIKIAAITGGSGNGGGGQNGGINSGTPGGNGGDTALGGGGGGAGALSGAQTTGANASPNSGGGGGGGSCSSAGGTPCWSGAGGGAGGYLEAIINSPSASYSYVVGTGGAGGSAGSAGGGAGGLGADGIIIIEEGRPNLEELAAL